MPLAVAVALVAPAGTLSADGLTVAIEPSSVARLTVAPPLGAGLVRLIVKLTLPPGGTRIFEGNTI